MKIKKTRDWHGESRIALGSGPTLPYGRALDCAHRIKAVLILLPGNNDSNTEFFLSNDIIINISSVSVL